MLRCLLPSNEMHICSEKMLTILIETLFFCLYKKIIIKYISYKYNFKFYRKFSIFHIELDYFVNARYNNIIVYSFDCCNIVNMFNVYI